MISWMKITSLGGITVMAPAAIVITAWLVAERAWRMALWWCLLFAAGMGLVVATKIAFIGWGIGVRSLDFTGFSGHSMRATAVIPVLFYLILSKTSPMIRASGVILGLVFGVIIGISRLVLHAHSVSEAVSGCILGGVVSLGFIWILGSAQKFVLYRSFIALSMIALLTVPYAEPAPTQRWIIGLALYLSGHDRPFVRHGWKLAPSSWTHPGF
ncbi:MAG: phosphatase PAP2 family protein [Glaciimonas sp.]|nr:phosphatase PAP2 family protein [Glaciimonas sp.]